MPNKPITIYDLAKQLKMSASTVSRALQDHPDVNKATKKKVFSLANRLDYHPNLVAQRLRKKRSNIIGVIVPDICYNLFSAAISGIEKVVNDAGYILMLSQSHENFQKEVEHTQIFLSSRIAGMLVSISENTLVSEHLKLVQRKGIPVVFFDRASDDMVASKVLYDVYEGSFQAVEYLVKTGRKRIAHISGPQQLEIGSARLKGYEDVLNKYDFPQNKIYVYQGGFNIEDGIAGMEWFLSSGPPPDAVFAANDEAAYGACQVIKRRGLKIPDDISVVGFSNDPISELMDPPLTTVDLPGKEIGEMAAQFLINDIEKLNINELFVPQEKMFKTKLVIREST